MTFTKLLRSLLLIYSFKLGLVKLIKTSKLYIVSSGQVLVECGIALPLLWVIKIYGIHLKAAVLPITLDKLVKQNFDYAFRSIESEND